LEILGQKWQALPNFLVLRNRQKLVLGKNNQVSLTIGQILGTAAENTGWLKGSALSQQKKHSGAKKCSGQQKSTIGGKNNYPREHLS
jgi:hypothetical protein